ncbi:MAG: hypothetical protein PHI11_07985 [Gallionella sp.]|nr:hypothetical protein [Gallionella sp.]
MARFNVFMAWFFIPITLGMGWIAATGRGLLHLLGIVTPEGSIPGILVGAVLLMATVFLVMYFRGSLPPEGEPEGKGFTYGQRLVLAGNILAAMFVIFQLTHPLIANLDVRKLLDGFTDAFGYWTLACWAIGFSLLYQSSLPVEK